MNISALLSALKVIDEVMKLLNNIEVHTYVYYHYTKLQYLLHDDYTGILKYPVSSPLVDQLVIGLCSVHTIDAAVNASLVNEYSNIKLKYVN